MARCRAVTADGSRCRRRVKKAGDRCYQHRNGSALWLRPATSKRSPRVPSRRSSSRTRGSPPSGTRPAPRYSGRAAVRLATPASPTPRRVQERKRVREAAVFCADSLSGSWEAAVADRISDYAQTSWQRLSVVPAETKLRGAGTHSPIDPGRKAQIHRLVGKLVGWAHALLALAGLPAPSPKNWHRTFRSPIDAKMIAVARGIQVAGILLCVMDNRELTKCECFRDLALAETKER